MVVGRLHEVRVDRSRRLAEQPGVGHNRWHPDIPPGLRLDPGDEAILDTLDAMDGYFSLESSTADIASVDLSVAHALTGPVWVNGAEPGDLLAVDLLEITPVDFGFTALIPGFGFLRDLFTEPFLVRWRLAHGYAESEDIPGVRIPQAAFPGVIGVAPSREMLRRIIDRESDTAARGGAALPPEPRRAVPATEPIASEGLRTIPPRESGGNVDIKHLTAGTTVYLPVFTEGALFSIGDAHFAQGDGECCGTAIEMGATFRLRFELQKGAAHRRGIRGIQYARRGMVERAPRLPGRFYATTGLSMNADGAQDSEDLELPTRNALLAMIEYLKERGYSAEQAYALCSVAVDLSISEIVDVPNFLVSAFLPLDIFV